MASCLNKDKHPAHQLYNHPEMEPLTPEENPVKSWWHVLRHTFSVSSQ